VSTHVSNQFPGVQDMIRNTKAMNKPQPPRLQLAVDVLDIDTAIDVVDRIYPHFDIVEIGTPLIIEAGLAAVEQIKPRCPDKQCLADLKIMDAGYMEGSSGFRRGADIVTVLGVADDATISKAVKAAREHGGELMADLINVADPTRRAAELAELGVSILCVHTAYDTAATGVSPLATLQAVRPVVTCQLAIAGGLALDDVGPAARCGADIVVVGGGILNQPDTRAAAAAIMARLQET